ncbi:LysR substrate-binding domain-containing protein [Comamonas sp. JC664]|uniref:LysR substrate-binding domain-containing protein n=1 Tax=Comamonas sp. JC664 TaxID=2801917 RepID=UPI0036225127
MSRAQAEPLGQHQPDGLRQIWRAACGPLVASYLQRYPQVEVQLLLLDRVVNLVEEGLDLAVRIAPLPDSSLVARHVVDIHQVIAASPALVAACACPSSRKTWLRCLHRVWRCGRRQPLGVCQPGPARARQGKGPHALQYRGGNIAGCIAGQGFGRFLHYQVMDAIARGELVRILPGHAPAPRPLSLVYPSKHHGTVRVSTLVEHLAEQLRARLGEFAPSAEKR